MHVVFLLYIGKMMDSAKINFDVFKFYNKRVTDHMLRHSSVNLMQFNVYIELPLYLCSIHFDMVMKYVKGPSKSAWY